MTRTHNGFDALALLSNAANVVVAVVIVIVVGKPMP